MSHHHQEKIINFYPWNRVTNLSNRLTLCLDNNSGSGEFIFVYLILALLYSSNKKIHINNGNSNTNDCYDNGDQKLCIKLICFNHNVNHYKSLLRKNVSYIRDSYVYFLYLTITIISI